jgi:hypothetical protein
MRARHPVRCRAADSIGASADDGDARRPTRGMRRPARGRQHALRPRQHQPRPPQQRQQQHQHGQPRQQAHGQHAVFAGFAMHGVRVGRAAGRCRRCAVVIVPGHGHVLHVMAHCGVVHAHPCRMIHRLYLQRAADQGRKHHQQRRQDGELEQEALRAGQAGHPASVEPGPGMPVRRTVAGGRGISRAAPCTRRDQGRSRSNSRSWFPEGRRGGSGCGGRCKYVHVSSVAASMRLTPPQPGPPRLRQFPAICSRSTPCVDESPSESNISNWNRKASTHGVDLPCRPRSTPTDSRRDLSAVGRCPTECKLLTWPLPLILRVQGAALLDPPLRP